MKAKCKTGKKKKLFFFQVKENTTQLCVQLGSLCLCVPEKESPGQKARQVEREPIWRFLVK